MCEDKPRLLKSRATATWRVCLVPFCFVVLLRELEFVSIFVFNSLLLASEIWVCEFGFIVFVLLHHLYSYFDSVKVKPRKS